MVHWSNLILLIIIFLGCTLFLISNKVKIVLGGLLAITLSLFVITIQFSTFTSSLVRFIASFTALLIVYLSYKEQINNFEVITRSAIIFRVMAFLVLIVVVLLEVNGISEFLKVPLEVIAGGLITIFCGLLQLGITSSPQKIILGIITLYIGFSSIYCIIESSLLVNGLLSAVTLLLGGLGMYFELREIRNSNE